jgi:hypothetical protein
VVTVPGLTFENTVTTALYQCRKFSFCARQFSARSVHPLKSQINDALEAEHPVLGCDVSERDNAPDCYALNELVLVKDN